MKEWIKALRLRTLPLALAVVGMGNLLAYGFGRFRWEIGALSLITAVGLQILSNLANDYGDSIHGADHHGRKGPTRSVQSGAISLPAMRVGITVAALFSLASGSLLLWSSFYGHIADAIPLFIVGLGAIGAAYFYTNGKRPYGYMALGDISVFVFFGLVAVMGTFYLHVSEWSARLVLPAVAMGFWSTAVLNVNNMRDIPSDSAAGKFTIPIAIGLQSAKWYQTFLVLGGAACLLIFTVLEGKWAWLGFGFGFLVMGMGLVGTWKSTTNEQLDQFLKPQAIGTLLAVLGQAILVVYFSN